MKTTAKPLPPSFPPAPSLLRFTEQGWELENSWAWFSLSNIGKNCKANDVVVLLKKRYVKKRKVQYKFLHPSGAIFIQTFSYSWALKEMQARFELLMDLNEQEEI